MSLLEQLNFNSDVEWWTPTPPRVRLRIASAIAISAADL